jgi:hypothetical protein
MKRICLFAASSAFLLHPIQIFGADATNAAPATIPTQPSKPAPSNRPPPAPPLTKEENAEINKAYGEAITTNPDLVTEQKDLKDKMKALQDQQKELQQKIDTALIQADPNLATLIAAHPNVHPSAPPAPKPSKPPKPDAAAKAPATPPPAPASAAAPADPAAPKPTSN